MPPSVMNIPLVFGDELRLEFPVAVSGDVNLELSILAFQGMAVPFVRGNGISFLILLISGNVNSSDIVVIL